MHEHPGTFPGCRQLLTLFFVSLPPATESHLGILKAKLAKYRAQLLEPPKGAGSGKVWWAAIRVFLSVTSGAHASHVEFYVLSIQGEGFDVMKSGDARVALVGFPSVGKVSI